MLHPLTLILCALLFALQSHAAPADKRGLLFKKPSEDAFYQVPASIGDYAPGAILQHRSPPAPIAAFGLDPVNLKASYQILYRTTNSFDEPIATVLTVLVPHNANFSRVMSYQVAEDSAHIDCAPSYALQLGSNPGSISKLTIITQAELLLMETSLQEGWVVIVPDHEGPDAAFLANKQAGQATLDGVRAALQSKAITGIEANASVALWGYSGGSLATGFAAELQPTYAPELKKNIVGAAVGGVAPNITTVLTTINKGYFSGVIPSGVWGIANQYKTVRDVLDKHIQPKYKGRFFAARQNCFAINTVGFIFQDVIGMFDSPDILYKDPTITKILNDNAMGGKAPQVPMYLYEGILEDLSPIGEADKLYEKWCSGGTSVQYVRELAAEHGSAVVTGAPGAVTWLRGVMDGKPIASVCTKRDVLTSLLDKSTIDVLPKFVLKALLGLLGAPQGW